MKVFSFVLAILFCSATFACSKEILLCWADRTEHNYVKSYDPITCEGDKKISYNSTQSTSLETLYKNGWRLIQVVGNNKVYYYMEK